MSPTVPRTMACFALGSLSIAIPAAPAVAQTTGACCFSYEPTECSVVTAEQCNQLFGEYMGDDTTCEDLDADGVADVCRIGACCWDFPPPLECSVMTRQTCEVDHDGQYMGDGTNCNDLNGDGIADACLPLAPGACCYSDEGSPECVMATAELCAQAFSGQYMGDGTNCNDADGNFWPDVCEPVILRPCCFADQPCVMLKADDCEAALGTPGEIGDYCSGDPLDTGPCCLADGTCAMIEGGCCLAVGGTWWPTGANACVGDYNDNGIDDACEPNLHPCCYGDLSTTCILTTLEHCNSLGGSYVGSMFDCRDSTNSGWPDACEEYVRVACCMPDIFENLCIMMPPSACAMSGGTWQPLGVVCADILQPCCLFDGRCVMMDPGCCEIRGGHPSPTGQTSCLGDQNANGIDDACESPQGCCLPDGACLILTPFECAAQQGSPLGEGINCTGVQQVCCMPDGSCRVIGVACCAVLGGSPSPTGASECLGDQNGNNKDDACEMPQGCCLEDGTCVMALPTNCLAQQGTSLGEGTSCAGVNRTCCLSDGSCIVVDPACCGAFGGAASPTGSSTCLGDHNGNGLDDACDFPPGPTWSQPPAGDLLGFSAASDFWWNEPHAIPFQSSPPNVNWPGLTSHDYELGAGVQSASVAGMWTITHGFLSKVVWWGNYQEDGVGDEIRGAGVQAFQLSIHANHITSTPALWLPDDPPQVTHVVAFAAANETDTGQVNAEGCRIYQYSTELPTPFVQPNWAEHWLEISALSADPGAPPAWRWQESDRRLYYIGGGLIVTTAEKSMQEPWHIVNWPPVPPEMLWRCSILSMQLLGLGAGPSGEVNRIVTDDFRSDGRPITTVTWWGCYLDNTYRPLLNSDVFRKLDGWFITIHPRDPNAGPEQSACPPTAFADADPSVLGVYFAPASSVEWTVTAAKDCSNRPIYAYHVALDQCTLLCSLVDPRTQTAPAQIGSFNSAGGLDFWIGIQAVTGATWSGATSTLADRVLTGHVASSTTSDGHFWSWMTSPGATPPWPSMQEACVGRIMNAELPPPSNWSFGGWMKLPGACAAPAQPVEMAFELVSSIGDGEQACCLGDGGCVDTTWVDCFFVHGNTAQGAGTACDQLSLMIDEQPADTEACVGRESVLTVVPCGRGPFSYQWWKDGEPPTPVGVNDDQLILESATPADAGSYYVDVSEPGSVAIRSESATLSVSEPVIGDCDLNCIRDGADIQPFVDAFLNGTPSACADMDSNGLLEMADAMLFVNMLLGA